MALNGRLLLELGMELTGSLDLASKTSSLRYTKQLDLADGSGANQVNKMFHDQRTLAASGTEDLDLAGSLVDPLGTTLTFAKIRALLIYAAAANTNLVNVGGAASLGFTTWVGDVTDVVKIRPGGLFLLTAPDATAYAVTAGTGDLLTITNSSSGTGVTYDIVILGS
jgi:hypothetical protein